MRGHKNLVLFLVLVIIVMGFASAAPPSGTPASQTQVSDTGIQISYPKYDYIPQNSEFDIHIHVINSSKPLTNRTTSCHFHLYNSSGQHSFKANMTYNGGGFLKEFDTNINSNNFSDLGTHAYIIECFTNNQAGFASGTFIVNPSGYYLELETIIIYILLILIIIGTLSFGIYSLSNVDEAAWLTFYTAISYVSLFLLSFVLWHITHDYLWQVPIFHQILYLTWVILGILFLPFILMFTGWLIYKNLESTLIKDYKEAGYSDSEAKALAKRGKR